MNRLKELRKEKSLSQKALADNFEVTEKTVSRWENGESQIKPDKAQQLADYFGVEVGYLLGYSDFVSKDEFIKSVEQTDFFDDGGFADDGEKDYFREFNLTFNIALLQHYHKETETLLNHILGAYIQKDTDKTLTSDELAQIPALLSFLESQPSQISEGGSFLKEVLHIIQRKYNL